MSMMTRSIAPLFVLTCGLATSVPAAATVSYPISYLNPAAACQLSVPNSNTQARPRASGYRNESATNSVSVICGFSASNDGSKSTVSYLIVNFTSIDGVSRNINCTAVSGLAGQYSQGYSTKSVSSRDSGNYATLGWEPDDFGWGASIPGGFAPSVTCTLPPQTAITLLTAGYMY